eukprot:6358027-Pyramimonas_sp.AAC.1
MPAKPSARPPNTFPRSPTNPHNRGCLIPDNDSMEQGSEGEEIDEGGEGRERQAGDGWMWTRPRFSGKA